MKKKETRWQQLWHTGARRWYWFVAAATVIVAVCVLIAWRIAGRRTALHTCATFETSTYPVAVIGNQQQGYVLTAGGGVFALPAWTERTTATVLQDHPTAGQLSASGKYLLIAGQHLTLLDSALKIRWSRKTSATSVVEHCLFTTDGKIAAVYSFLKSQARQYALYDLTGRYLEGFKVPDFAAGAQTALAGNGMLVLTLANGTIYTVARNGTVIGKFSVPNPGAKLGGLTSAVNSDGTRILAGYGFLVSGQAGSLPRYLYDPHGAKIAQFSVPSDSTGIKNLGTSFLVFGKKAWFISSAGKVVLSTSKPNFQIIDAAVAPGQLALLFQEQTTSQTAVYFLGIYDFTTRKLLRQWSTAESQEPQLFLFPGTRAALTFSSSLLILCP